MQVPTVLVERPMDAEPPTGFLTFPVVLARRAVSPRGVARAAEVWRMAQEAAVQAACAVGWPPERLRSEGVAFIVSEMTMEHLRELAYGERVVARTWIRDFRRATLSHREVRLDATEGPFARASQRWIHVIESPDGGLHIGRARAELLAAFAPSDVPDAAVDLPRIQTVAEGGRLPVFECDIWHTWMDPIGHLNHPTYLDLMEEALARACLDAGTDPQGVIPVAERLSFRSPAVAGDRVSVELQVQGHTLMGDLALTASVRRSDGELCASGTLIRRHRQDDLGALLSLEAAA